MEFWQTVKIALKSISSNKLRSFLTMLGMVIGISSVIILVAMGQGTKSKVASQIQGLGTNLITVSITGNRNKSISNEEIAELKKQPGIKEIAPVITNSASVKYTDQDAQTVSIEATTPEYEEVRNTHVQSGRFINQLDVDNHLDSILIGTDVVDEIMNTRDVIGKKLLVNGYEFTVVGLLEQKGSSMSGSSDLTIIMPVTTAERLFKNTNIRTFYVEATSSDKVDTAMGYLQLFMNTKFNSSSSGNISNSSNNSSSTNNNFRIFNQTELLSTVNASNDSMTMMLAGIAAISLLVGGIGIMNIMLVSVTERTREIGIRKAIGAKRSRILMQFLVESVVVSGIGGLLGVVIGCIGSSLINKFFNIAMQVPGNVVLLAFGFSVTVGIVFGLYPANKASKLNPIEALRYE